MKDHLTPTNIERLSAEIDYQLQALKALTITTYKGLDNPNKLLAQQMSAIKEAAKEPPISFLGKFCIAAKSDLCEEGGVLYAQWKKWADLDNQEVIEKFSAVIVAMGFTGSKLEILLVAVAVIVIHIGVKAFCEEYSE